MNNVVIFFFFFNATATTEIYTLSLHDALPISILRVSRGHPTDRMVWQIRPVTLFCRSEEHTSELQSRENLVCRLLLEKKKLFLMLKKLFFTNISCDVISFHDWYYIFILVLYHL